MQRLTCVALVNLAHYGKRPYRPCAWSTRDFARALASFPNNVIVVFGLGTRLHVRMRTTLENGVLRNGQQPQSVVNGFYRPG